MEQSKILVVTDTTSGWNEADAQKAGVALVALSVLLDDKEYKDQIEMRANELYAAQAEGKLPTTSQPNPADINVGHFTAILCKEKNCINRFFAVYYVSCQFPLVHFCLSISAIIFAISSRRICSRATISSISALSFTISITSLVSSCST